MSYYSSTTLSETTFENAIEAVTSELSKEGFGIISEIDVSATFKKKIDVDFKKYTILGACNPPLAFKAVNASPEVGMFLPCNVTVEETGPGASTVRFLDPDLIMGQAAFGEMPEMMEVAVEAKERLMRAADALRA